MGHNGNLKKRRNYNPILDTREYVVQYPDRSEDTLTYAKMVDLLVNQLYTEGNHIHVYSGIFGHQKGSRSV